MNERLREFEEEFLDDTEREGMNRCISGMRVRWEFMETSRVNIAWWIFMWSSRVLPSLTKWDLENYYPVFVLKKKWKKGGSVSWDEEREMNQMITLQMKRTRMNECKFFPGTQKNMIWAIYPLVKKSHHTDEGEKSSFSASTSSHHLEWHLISWHDTNWFPYFW